MRLRKTFVSKYPNINMRSIVFINLKKSWILPLYIFFTLFSILLPILFYCQKVLHEVNLNKIFSLS